MLRPISSRTNRSGTRAHRPETDRTISVERVSQAVLAAVERNRFMTYVPRYYGLLAWLAAAAPAAVKPLWRRLMSSRIEDLYARSGGNPVG